MSALPLEPELAKLLLCSPDFSCTQEILTIVALLSSPNIFMRPREAAAAADASKAQFAHPDGDHATLLNAYYSFVEAGSNRDWAYENFINFRSITSAVHVRNQLERILDRLEVPRSSMDYSDPDYSRNIRRCLSAGGFMQVAHLQRAGHYLTVKDHQVVHLRPSSVLEGKPAFVLFGEFVQTTRNYIRTCTTIEAEWLLESAGHYFDLSNFPEGETKSELVRCLRRMKERAQAKRSRGG